MEWLHVVINFIKDHSKTLFNIIRKHVDVITLIVCVAMAISMYVVFDSRLDTYFTNAIENYWDQMEKEHKQAFQDSKELGIAVRRELKQHQRYINCDYMVLLEYHNGSSNIATGNQFCKFDITHVVLGDSVRYVQTIEYFTDENILKYDALLDPELQAAKVYVTTMEDLKCRDIYSYSVLENYTSNIETVGMVNLEYNGQISGTLLFMFNPNQKVDTRAMLNCALEVEKLFNNAAE